MQKKYGYFSAAIRDGIKLRPQAAGSLLIDGASCAIGAGIEAMWGYDALRNAAFDASDEFGPEKTFDYLMAPCAECPAGCHSEDFDDQDLLIDMIWHLNDQHQWTRTAIADWLYAEEEKLGWVTIDTEALKPEVALDRTTMKVTALFPS